MSIILVFPLGSARVDGWLFLFTVGSPFTVLLRPAGNLIAKRRLLFTIGRFPFQTVKEGLRLGGTPQKREKRIEREREVSINCALIQMHRSLWDAVCIGNGPTHRSECALRHKNVIILILLHANKFVRIDKRSSASTEGFLVAGCN